MEFSYFLPVNIQFGWNKVDSVADYVAPYGKKALIVTGRTSAKKSGLYDRVVAKLETAHIDHVLFDQVDANPLTTTALEGAALAKSESCEYGYRHRRWFYHGLCKGHCLYGRKRRGY